MLGSLALLKRIELEYEMFEEDSDNKIRAEKCEACQSLTDYCPLQRFLESRIADSDGLQS